MVGNTVRAKWCVAGIVLLILAAAMCLHARAAVAQQERDLIVGTKAAPPFAMKNAEGQWDGISIALWRHVADAQHLGYRIEEFATVSDLIDAVRDERVDVAVAALTVTAERRRFMDFTQPFFQTGLGVAMVRRGLASWLPLTRAFVSLRFLQAVAVLLVIALFVGTLIWLFERRENEHYGGGKVRGFVAGAWWSAIAMTQAGAAQNGPRSTPGRVLAVIWMVASVVTIAVFIAGITSTLTTERLQGLIRDAHDLRRLHVGAISGSSTEEFLTSQRIGYRSFAGLPDGLAALQSGRIDAFVYDRPLLAWTLRQDFPQLELINVTLGSEDYAFALPVESRLRASLDVGLLDAIRSDWWEETRFRYLGAGSAH
jgi:ABC-type amino acid transport substrate-binding protein